LKESLQNKGIPTEVEGHKGYVGVNGKGRVVQGDKVPEDSRMMEKREAEQVSKKKRKRLGEEKQQEKREERAQEKLDKALI
jgi:hypothetical protein